MGFPWSWMSRWSLIDQVRAIKMIGETVHTLESDGLIVPTPLVFLAPLSNTSTRRESVTWHTKLKEWEAILIGMLMGNIVYDLSKRAATQSRGIQIRILISSIPCRPSLSWVWGIRQLIFLWCLTSFHLVVFFSCPSVVQVVVAWKESKRVLLWSSSVITVGLYDCCEGASSIRNRELPELTFGWDCRNSLYDASL